MTPERDTAVDGRAALALVTLLDHLRQIDGVLLHALGRGRGADSELSAAAAVVISRAEIEDLRRACMTIEEMATKAVELAAAVPSVEIELRAHQLAAAAEAELAGGVEAVHRVELLAACLPVKRGFRALSEALRCTDCHLSWGDATLGDVLRRFRESDSFFIRRLTERAKLSPNTRWVDCDRAQVTQLAAVLAEHADTDRCRGAA